MFNTMKSTNSNRNYHYQSNNIFGTTDIKNENKNGIGGGIGAKMNQGGSSGIISNQFNFNNARGDIGNVNGLNARIGGNDMISNAGVINKAPSTANKQNNNTNLSLPSANLTSFGLNKPNVTNINNFNGKNTGSKFFTNVNLNSTMNQQERVINFGQDSNENSFKRILRKNSFANPLQTSSYNIITGAPYPNPQNTLNVKYNKSFNSAYSKPGQLDDMLSKFKNTSLTNIGTNNGYEKREKENSEKTNLLDDKTQITNHSPYHFTNYKSKIKQSNTISTPRNKLSSSEKIGNETQKHASSVKEYSYKEDQNIRCRSTMEDMSKVVEKIGGESSNGLFAIYDGHGGADVAKYSKDRLPEIFEKLYTSSEGKDKESLLISTFQKVDEELKYIDAENMGATATVVFITKEKDSLNNKRVAYCANVGDSRSVVISNYGVKRLSYDHKASDPSEIKRIINSGGVIFGGRVFGQLILTRALGDHALQSHGVVSTPYTSKHHITDKDKYIVIASDGVWDVFTDDEMYRLSLQITNSEDFANLIVKSSLARGSQDNISCLVLKLN